MSRDDPQMKIRLPAELKAGVEGSAKANNRTMNAEIVARLQASFDDQPARSGLPPGTIEELERLFEEKLGGRVYIDRADGGKLKTIAPTTKRGGQ